MKTEKNILIAFLLNLSFSVLEFIGGTLTNSVAIISDSIHDMGDAMSIGVSYFLEKKSKQKPDDKYTYGYIRYSVLGSLITTFILVLGSILVIYNAIKRIINPVEINYNGMILFAIFGVVINFVAAYFTREGDSLNQKSVNLHMLEDVLGWIVVLIGAVVMRFTDIKLIDPILSIAVAIFILINALKTLKNIVDLFLEKTPNNININEIKEHLLKIDGVKDVHHIHVRSVDGYTNYATMHIVAEGDFKEIKHNVKEELVEHGIVHTTIELEEEKEECQSKKCEIKSDIKAIKRYNQDEIEELVKILKNDGVICVPTDTVFGICASMNSNIAYDKLIAVKNRPMNKSFPIMCANEEQIKSIAIVNDMAEKLIKAFMPGPITLVLKKNKELPNYITNGKDTVAIRMATSEPIKNMILKLKCPIFMTSANKSGESNCTSLAEIEKKCPNLDGMMEGNIIFSKGSTIIDCSTNEVKILREGPILKEKIDEIINL